MTTDIDHPTGCVCCGDLLHRCFDRRRFLHLSAGTGLIAAFPSLAFGAEENYDAMLLTCIDPRFREPTIKYMEGRHMVGEYNLMALDGTVEMFG